MNDATRMVKELLADGLMANEVAEMIGVSENTLKRWKSGRYVPQTVPFAKLVQLHKGRGLDEGWRYRPVRNASHRRAEVVT